jgi:hypothetical protein
MLSTHLHLGLPSGLFSSGFPTITYTRSSSPPFMSHVSPSLKALTTDVVTATLFFSLSLY